uniref:Uncharacterized protein n=1 Tax=Ixodes ricinus TaxID=34613 RepID=V5HJJ4_IXORI
MVEDLLQREVEAKAKLVELKEHIEQIVREEKAKSDTYITMEKLDAAIEFAIEHPVSYSYATRPKRDNQRCGKGPRPLRRCSLSRSRHRTS